MMLSDEMVKWLDMEPGRIDDTVREEAKGSHESGNTDLCYSRRIDVEPIVLKYNSRPDPTLRPYDG